MQTKKKTEQQQWLKGEGNKMMATLTKDRTKKEPGRKDRMGTSGPTVIAKGYRRSKRVLRLREEPGKIPSSKARSSHRSQHSK